MTLPTRPNAMSLRDSILINRPVAAVWKSVLEFPKWAPTIQKAELVLGEWDREGGCILITKKDWVGLSPFYSYNLVIRPYEQMVNKLDSKDGNQVNAFVDLTFVRIGEQTQVTYSNYAVISPTTASKEKIESNQGDFSVASIYLKPMKQYAEETY